MSYPSIRDDTAHAEIIGRLEHLTPSSERRWGVMEPEKLLPHLIDGLRLALEGTDRVAKGVLATPLMRHLVIHRVEWPGGRAKAPEGAFSRVSEDWDAERAALIALIARYRETPHERLGAAHPTFGRMKGRDWDVIVWRHLDHHLRQFGC